MNNATSRRAMPFARLMLITTVLATAVPLKAEATEQNFADQIAAIKKAAERFEDVNVALAEGYIPDPSGHCVSAEAEGLPAEWGAMGIHYMRPDVLGITATQPRVDGNGLNTDFLKPSILLYEPQADGSMKLVGAENLVFEKAWKEAGHKEGPASMGRNWDRMADDPNTKGDEAHGFMPHYDQHVWFVNNPAGQLMPFNPAITCEYQQHAHTN
ncbi:MAG: hypothetical protein WAU86_11840 [Oricola sp.]